MPIFAKTFPFASGLPRMNERGGSLSHRTTRLSVGRLSLHFTLACQNGGSFAGRCPCFRIATPIQDVHLGFFLIFYHPISISLLCIRRRPRLATLSSKGLRVCLQQAGNPVSTISSVCIEAKMQARTLTRDAANRPETYQAPDRQGLSPSHHS